MPIDRSVGNYFDSSSSFLRRVGRLKGPASYVTGGELLDASALGLGKVVVVMVTVARSAVGLAYPAYDYATGRLLWYDQAGAQVANATNLAAYEAGIEVIGT